MIAFILFVIWYVVGYWAVVTIVTIDVDFTVGYAAMTLVLAVIGPLWWLPYLVIEKKITGKVLVPKKGTR